MVDGGVADWMSRIELWIMVLEYGTHETDGVKALRLYQRISMHGASLDPGSNRNGNSNQCKIFLLATVVLRRSAFLGWEWLGMQDVTTQSFHPFQAFRSSLHQQHPSR